MEALEIGQFLGVKKIQLRGQAYCEEGFSPAFGPMKNDKVRMLLDLPETPEVLFNSFKSKLRSQVRRAEKNGVEFQWAGKDGVDSFYSVFCSNMRSLGSPVHSKKLFQAIIDGYGEYARIGLVEIEGRCIGAGLILSTKDKTSIPWASTLRQYNRLAPNMLLYWNCLKFAVDDGKKVFDFGRSTEGEGTYRFKKQWGAQPVPLKWYTSPAEIKGQLKVNQPISNKREIVAEVWRKMPLFVTNYFGPILRKYINL